MKTWIVSYRAGFGNGIVTTVKADEVIVDADGSRLSPSVSFLRNGEVVTYFARGVIQHFQLRDDAVIRKFRNTAPDAQAEPDTEDVRSLWGDDEQ